MQLNQSCNVAVAAAAAADDDDDDDDDKIIYSPCEFSE